MVNPGFLDALSSALSDVYADCVDRILINLARHFRLLKPGEDPGGSFEWQARKLAQIGQVNAETMRIIRDMLRDADPALKDCLEAAIKDALADVEPGLREAAYKGLLNGGYVPPVLDPRLTNAFLTYYQQAADKLNLVNTVMLESTENAYRATVSDVVARMQTAQTIVNQATGQVVSGIESFNSALRTATNRMVANGITGFIDHAGRHWHPETYIEMDMRTTFHNTARQAFWDRNADYANDLYLVSQHPGARPLCYPWQCKVISRNDHHRWVTDGNDKPVQVFAQSETSYGEPAGLFGINCRHHPELFIPGVSLVPEVRQDEEANAETYALSQQQRGYERALRETKLAQKVAKAQGDDEGAAKAKRDLERVAERYKDFLDRTGRKRRQEREYTPVDAKWADADTPSPTDIRDFITDYFKNRR